MSRVRRLGPQGPRAEARTAADRQCGEQPGRGSSGVGRGRARLVGAGASGGPSRRFGGQCGGRWQRVTDQRCARRCGRRRVGSRGLRYVGMQRFEAGDFRGDPTFHRQHQEPAVCDFLGGEFLGCVRIQGSVDGGGGFPGVLRACNTLRPQRRFRACQRWKACGCSLLVTRTPCTFTRIEARALRSADGRGRIGRTEVLGCRWRRRCRVPTR